MPVQFDPNVITANSTASSEELERGQLADAPDDEGPRFAGDAAPPPAPSQAPFQPLAGSVVDEVV